MSEGKTTDADARRARLRRALRENLKRRKAQARGRAARRVSAAARDAQNDEGR